MLPGGANEEALLEIWGKDYEFYVEKLLNLSLL